MVQAYFECFQNAAIAEREYISLYPNRRHYGGQVFARLVQRLRATGSFRRRIFRRNYITGREDNVINVLAYITFNPHISIRSLSCALGITRSTVHNILKQHR